jgi:hypothetical protein
MPETDEKMEDFGAGDCGGLWALRPGGSDFEGWGTEAGGAAAVTVLRGKGSVPARGAITVPVVGGCGAMGWGDGVALVGAGVREGAGI